MRCEKCHADRDEAHLVLPHPYRVEVVVDSSGKYCGNGLSFATVEDAATYARDLWRRWTLVTQARVVEGPLDEPTVAMEDAL